MPNPITIDSDYDISHEDGENIRLQVNEVSLKIEEALISSGSCKNEEGQYNASEEAILRFKRKTQERHEKNRKEQQQDLARKLTAKELQNLFNEWESSGKYTKSQLDFLQPLIQSKNKSEYQNGVEKILTTHSDAVEKLNFYQRIIYGVRSLAEKMKLSGKYNEQELNTVSSLTALNSELEHQKAIENILKVLSENANKFNYSRFSQIAQSLVQKWRDSDKYIESVIELFVPLTEVKNESEFQEAIENIISTHNLTVKRLDRAVEVDYKAYLPEKAPKLYVDWKKEPENKGKNVLDCLNEIWGEYLKKGVLYQDNLRSKNGGLDKKLIEALNNYCRPKKLKVEDYIPKNTSRHKQTAKIINKKAACKAKNLANKYG